MERTRMSTFALLLRLLAGWGGNLFTIPVVYAVDFPILERLEKFDGNAELLYGAVYQRVHVTCPERVALETCILTWHVPNEMDTSSLFITIYLDGVIPCEERVSEFKVFPLPSHRIREGGWDTITVMPWTVGELRTAQALGHRVHP